MSRLGRRQPFAPIINTMIQFDPPVPPDPIGKAVQVSRVAVDSSANRHATRHPGNIVYGRLIGNPVPPGIGKLSSTTLESVRRAYRRAADIYTPFIQTIRPPDPIKIPPLCPTDPNAPTRTREHCDYVSVLLNSLIMQRELIKEQGQTARGDWKLGYVPETYQNWGNPAPTTVKDALDEIAARLKALENP